MHCPRATNRVCAVPAAWWGVAVCSHKWLPVPHRATEKGAWYPWKLDINEFAAKIAETDTAEWRHLKKDVKAFYVQQNAVCVCRREKKKCTGPYTGSHGHTHAPPCAGHTVIHGRGENV